MRNKARRLSLTGYFLWVTTHQLCLSLTPLLLPSLCRQPWCSMASAQGSATNSHVDSCQWQLVILSSPFCHFWAPVLTFRKCCLCPSKLGAPDGGGHESLPFVQTHNYPGDREIKTTHCCSITHARNLVHLGQRLKYSQSTMRWSINQEHCEVFAEVLLQDVEVCRRTVLDKKWCKD